MTGAEGVGLVGCGNIAERYATTLVGHDDVRLLAVTDQRPERARQLGARHGLRVHDSLDAMLADDAIGVVVNLTIHDAHAEVTRRALEAGRHVYSEKPLAMGGREAHELVRLAAARGLRLGCSPMTWLGEAQQTAWKLVRDGRLGTVRVVHAEVNWGRIERWHPDPEPFYEVGPLVDVGVYPLTILTAWFGPARRVRAMSQLLHRDRQTLAGAHFSPRSPDYHVALVELEDGPLVRLTCNFYVGHHSPQRGIELHGDDASLRLASFDASEARIELAPFEGEWELVPPLREPFGHVDWGLGVREMLAAIRDGRQHRASGEQAAHVCDVIDAVATSAREERSVEVRSSFPRPEPLDWAR